MSNNKIIRKKLINFFSNHSIEEAESDAGKSVLIKTLGMRDWQELLQNKDYLQNYEPIQQLRRELDNSIEGVEGRDQVQSCLALLHSKKKSRQAGDIEILKTFIKNENPKCPYKTWNKEQQDLYDEALSVILGWDDFFFSYTNRNLPETNNSFKELIIQSFRESDFKDTKNEINYLAKLIVRYLNVRNLQSFYDKDNIVCGDNIQEKILEKCKSCYVFVQLIEEEVFHELSNKKNWCHLEFEEFDNFVNEIDINAKRQYFFITFGKEIIFPPNIPVPPRYSKWREKAEQLEYINITKELTNLELKKKIIELAGEIFNIKGIILSNYLGDFYSENL